MQVNIQRMKYSERVPRKAKQSNTPPTTPVYLNLVNSQKLKVRIGEALAALHNCHLCGNDCGIDRTIKTGPCRIGETVYVASYGPHHGEENVLRGSRGSGTIFFSGCNLHCVYCQNSDISQTTAGYPIAPGDLADIMLDLQERGCHNINLVSPTHVAAHLVPGIAIAIQAGLQIPIVYNTGGYDAPQALSLMEGLVDIYMPDMKYSDSRIGEQLSLVKNYPEVNQAAVLEMHRQVGDLVTDELGIARRGLPPRSQTIHISILWHSITPPINHGLVHPIIILSTAG
jgi:putative pyruvate formate lyase activating enzyme